MQNISTNTLCVGYLLRKYISTNIPQYSFIAQMYGSEHTARRRGRFIAPVFQPNQMVLMCRNDANCNAILCNYVGTGTINRSLRLRGGRGETWVNGAINNKMGNTKYINEHIMCGLFIAQIYINEHSAIFIYCANVWQRTHRKA